MREDAFFFYGTLMDRDLLSAVLDRRVWPRALAAAVLRGYWRRGVRGASYPIVVPQRGASVEGVILDRVSTVERACLSAYEGDGYELAQAVAQLPCRGLKRVFLFRPRGGAYGVSSRPWSFVGWRLRHKRPVMRALAAARRPRVQR